MTHWKIGNGLMHTGIRIITVLVVLAVGSLSPAWARSGAQVSPTTEWVNFYGVNTTWNGELVPAGTVIAAYDPQGTLCGQFVVHTPGRYGLLACYRDDPNTPEDEGAEPGDSITFTMNGQAAVQLGPDSARWTSNGDLMQVELSAGGAASAPSGTIRGTVFLDADGDGIYDAGEAPIAGVTVTAISNGGFEIPLRSGEDGTFGFVGIHSAHWTLRVTVPEGYAASGPTLYTDIWLGAGNWQVLDKNFGLVSTAPLLLPVAGSESRRLTIALGLLIGGGLLVGGNLSLRRRRQRQG